MSDNELFEDSDIEEPEIFDEAKVISKHLDPFTRTVTGFHDAKSRDAIIRRQAVRNEIESYHRELNTLQQSYESLDLRKLALQVEIDKLSAESDSLDLQSEQLYSQFEKDRSNTKIQAHLSLLQKQQKRVDSDLETAERQYREVCSDMRLLDSSMGQIKLKHGDLVSVDSDLKAQEEIHQKEMAIVSNLRVQQEKAAVAQHIKRVQQQADAALAKKKALEEKRQRDEDAGKKTQKMAQDKVNKTVAQQREVEQAQQAAAQSAHQAKVASVLQLKREIESAANKEVRASQKKAKAKAEQAALDAREREAILQQMGNPDAVFRARALERQQQEAQRLVAQNRRQKELDIVEKLQREEARRKKEQQKLLQTSKPAATTTINKAAAKAVTIVATETKPALSMDTWTKEGAEPQEHSDSEEDVTTPAVSATFQDSDEDSDQLFIEPEFGSLWEGGNAVKKQFNNFIAPEAPAPVPSKYNLTTKPLSVLEQTMMATALTRQKENIAQKQVVGGREFVGVPFSCKPSVVVFKDFEVGKTYRRKLILTNVSYGSNSFHTLETPADFIEYEYTPSGVLSSGLSTEMTVVFTPRVNEDFELKIALFAQTGPFEIPLQCLTKKFAASVSCTEVDFGTVCRGESASRQIQLVNSGSLASPWQLRLLDLENRPVAAEPLAADSDVPGVNASDFGTEAPAFLSNAITVTSPLQGALDAFATSTIELHFAPTTVGAARAEFVVDFGGIAPSLTVQATGQCSDLPVQLQHTVANFLTCQFGRVYTDNVVVCNNHTTTSVKVQFELPPECRKYFEFFPRNAILQPKKAFTSAVKFMPKSDMITTCPQYCNAETGLMNVPLTVRISQQTLPLSMTLLAHVTPSVITCDTENIDFGAVSVFESVVKTIKLTNTSALTQKFGFMELAPYLSMQPADGFGTLLPFETLSIDVIFSPRKPLDGDYDRDYSTSITCKWGVGGTLKIACVGQGVVPPLLLSSRFVKFAATSFGNTTSVSVFLSNTGKTSRLFEFVIPEHMPVSISPRAGELPPNTKQRLRICLQPAYPPEAQGSSAIEALEKAASQVFSASIACFNGEKPQSSDAVPSLLARDTVWLDVEAPVIPPTLAVITGVEDVLDPSIKFGQLPISKTASRSITVKNLTDEVLTLKGSALDTRGPFHVVHAFRDIAPRDTQTFSIRFDPIRADLFFEVLEVSSQFSSVSIKLSGEGIKPSLEIFPNQELHMGDVLAGITVTKKLQLKNTSPVPISFTIQFPSASYTLSPTQQASLTGLTNDFGGMVLDVQTDPLSALPIVTRGGLNGSNNLNCVSAFAVTPTSATIAPQKDIEVSVTFQPDHASLHYLTHLAIHVSDETEDAVIRVRGRGHPRAAFVLGFDDDDLSLPDDAIVASTSEASLPTATEMKKTLVFKYSLSKNKMEAMSRQLKIGLASSSDKKKMSTADYVMEPGAGSPFSVQPSRGTADSSQLKDIAIIFTPPKEGALLGRLYESSARLTISGAIYLTTLKAYIVP